MSGAFFAAFISEMFDDFRTVRKERQKPAHKIDNNEFDQIYMGKQRELMIKAFNAVRTLRMTIENHPNAAGYEIPNYLREAKVWTR